MKLFWSDIHLDDSRSQNCIEMQHLPQDVQVWNFCGGRFHIYELRLHWRAQLSRDGSISSSIQTATFSWCCYAGPVISIRRPPPAARIPQWPWYPIVNCLLSQRPSWLVKLPSSLSPLSPAPVDADCVGWEVDDHFVLLPGVGANKRTFSKTGKDVEVPCSVTLSWLSSVRVTMKWTISVEVTVLRPIPLVRVRCHIIIIIIVIIFCGMRVIRLWFASMLDCFTMRGLQSFASRCYQVITDGVDVIEWAISQMKSRDISR